MPPMPISDYDYFMRRLGGMDKDRTTFVPHWMELSQKFQPRRGRFFVTDINKGGKAHQMIINSKGTQALKIARAGLHAGIMSPARPWFELGTPDPDLMEFQPVKVWLVKVRAILDQIFRQSNLYNMAPTMLAETLLFGTGCMLHQDDFEDVARFYTQTIGSYFIAQDERLVVSTLARKYMMTPPQIIGAFGAGNASLQVNTAYDRGDYDTAFEVCHFVEPNPDFRENSPLSIHKRFRSCYFEPGNAGLDKGKFLERKGFDEFPAYCPRWETTGEDTYGTDCPGMVSLGDVNQLQIMEKRKAQGIDKHVNPPLHGPASLRNSPVSSLPGGLTTYDAGGEHGLRPVYEVRPDLQGLMLDIEKVEQRIDLAWYVDLFKPITNMEGIQPHNELTLSSRNQEALLQLGPTLEALHGQFLSPLIDRTFNQAIRAGILPPAPPELEGMALKVTYVSTLAQAMRQVAAGSLDRLSAYVGGLVQSGLHDGKKFDGDQAIDEMANILGAPPRVVVPDEVVLAQRQQEQQMQQMQQAMAMAQAGANTAKGLADAKTGEPSALTTIAGAMP